MVKGDRFIFSAQDKEKFFLFGDAGQRLIDDFEHFQRLCGRDALRLRPPRTAARYWIERRALGPHPETKSRQFYDSIFDWAIELPTLLG